MKGTPAVCAACARVIALAVILVVAPLPVAAGEISPPSTPPPNLTTAIQKVARAEGRALTSARLAQAAQPGTERNLQSPSFFKTPLGLAVIAIVGGGTAYAVYSSQHDRIHSQARAQ